MLYHIRSFQKDDWMKVLAVMGALLFIWLCISWFFKWFPFSSRHISYPQEQLNSLTAPENQSVVPASVLESLTARS